MCMFSVTIRQKYRNSTEIQNYRTTDETEITETTEKQKLQNYTEKYRKIQKYTEGYRSTYTNTEIQKYNTTEIFIVLDAVVLNFIVVQYFLATTTVTFMYKLLLKNE